MRYNNILVGWHAMPRYGVNAVNDLAQHFGSESISCLVTRGVGMLSDYNEHLTVSFDVVDRFDVDFAKTIIVNDSTLFLKTSWNHPLFERISRQVRKVGGAVVMLSDNIDGKGLRKIFGPLIFRYLWKKRHAGVIVPGLASKRYFRRFGFDERRIFTGLYYGDPQLFRPATKVKKFCYVGQLVERKNIRALMDAWKQFAILNNGWVFEVIGDGPLRSCVESAGVHYLGQRSSEEVAKCLASCHALFLPSYVDHWGVVLHEAALSGTLPCGSALCGAIEDLVPPEMSDCVIRGNTVSAIFECMQRVSLMDPLVYSNILRDRALGFGSERFVRAVTSCLADFSET